MKSEKEIVFRMINKDGKRMYVYGTGNRSAYTRKL